MRLNVTLVTGNNYQLIWRRINQSKGNMTKLQCSWKTQWFSWI